MIFSYSVLIFGIFFFLGLSYRLTYINYISFWILYSRIQQNITKIELNIIVINYEHLSEQRRRMIIFLTTLLYFPFFRSYLIIKFIRSVEKQYVFHFSYYISIIVYIERISFLFTHYDFAYSTFMDLIIPEMIQKCIDFSIFFLHYKGYFYDFFLFRIFYRNLILTCFRYPSFFSFYIKTYKTRSDFSYLFYIRLFNSFLILYYFGSYSFLINFIVFFRSCFFTECLVCILRLFTILHRIKKC